MFLAKFKNNELKKIKFADICFTDNNYFCGIPLNSYGQCGLTIVLESKDEINKLIQILEKFKSGNIQDGDIIQ